MTDSILTRNEDGVLIVTLNRPHKKNAIDNEMWVALREAFTRADIDDSVACVLLTGAEDNFCAGVDLSSFSIPGDEFVGGFPEDFSEV